MDERSATHRLKFYYVSIPESGFCLFGQRNPTGADATRKVSIPESGFCLFGPGQAKEAARPAARFQSLSRDSVCLDSSCVLLVSPVSVVSIPESGFCLFGPGVMVILLLSGAVSIPESGFCLFGPPVVTHRAASARAFQSLSRDSVCLDLTSATAFLISSTFQSLSRDSVCLDITISASSFSSSAVSIPESGFCLFGRR